ncbi:MAG: UDP-glucose 4-epimerase GalE [Tibeticola sp.]
MKHVLVTGGAGYIGSHACKALAAAGYVPVTYDNLVTGHRSAVRWGPFVHGDVLDRAALDAALRVWQPVAVMHFAACIEVGESMRDPGKYYRNNLAGALNVLQALVTGGVSRLVFSSTAAVYGMPLRSPIAEDHPLAPVNPYGAAKWMVERMLSDFDAAHGLRSISLRYFNAAGADPACETGEAHDPESHLIPLVLDAASGRRPSVSVFGSDYPTRDGTCVRDYIHVSDLAQAHVLALQALEHGAATTAYNLGNGRGFSVREVIGVCREVTGREIAVVEAPPRPGDAPELVAEAQKARRELGWNPQHASLQEIVATAWRWHQRWHVGGGVAG